MVWPATCDGCGGDVSRAPEGDSCPACGHFERTVHVSASDSALGEDTITRVSVSYARERSWEERWQAVLASLEELRRSYLGRTDGPSDTNDWIRIPVGFCVDCYHLKDWLLRTGAVGNPRDLEQWIKGTGAISTTGDVANSQKHGLKPGDKGFARVANVDVRFDGAERRVSFTVEWERPTGTWNSRDALALADEAVDEWRGFLTRHGLLT